MSSTVQEPAGIAVNDQQNEASAPTSTSTSTSSENSTVDTGNSPEAPDSAPTEVSDAGADTPGSTKSPKPKKRRTRAAADLHLDTTSSEENNVSAGDYDTDRLKERRKKSHHWRQQANKYGWVLEDRIKFLEARFAKLTGEDLKGEKEGEKLKEGPDLDMDPKIPEGVRILTWQEYCVDKGRSRPDRYAMIDVLLEDALPFNPHGKVWLSANKDLPVQTTEELIARAKDFDRLPERIRINSRQIQEMLRNIARSDEVGFVSDVSTIVCIKPFKMLYSLEFSIRDCLKDQENSLAQLKKGKEDTKDEERCKKIDLEMTDLETEIKHIEAVIQVIDIFLKPIQLRLGRMSSSNSVRFEELWLLFKPGCFVVVNEREVTQRIWKVVQKTGGRRYLRPKDTRDYDDDEMSGDFGDTSSFALDCCYIDFNGEQLGVVMRTFYITNFDGRQPIRSLSVYPLESADAELLETKPKLREMGELFLEHTKVQHRYYSGKTLGREPSGTYLQDSMGMGDRTEIAASVESAVVVDFGMTFQYQSSWQPSFVRATFSRDNSREYQEVQNTYDSEQRELVEGQDWLKPDSISRDFEWDQKDRLSVQAALDLERKRWDQGINPSGDILMLLPGRVFGFVLKSRSWAPLKLELLRKITADQDALTDLQLPNGYRDVIQSMIEWQFSKGSSMKLKNEPEFDVVRNKGRGLIILLHGAPGLGKTSTAECVANANSKPLLSITCGALGETAERVESGLQNLFRLAQAWDCVLLLDEADVFLAERTLQDMTRNGIVSVFLRTLEYYEGILFLTTNRVGELDEAFRSRIHMALYYPPLDADRTYKVWEMQIRRLYKMVPNLICNKQGILDYGTRLFSIQDQKKPGTGWNARQIRNAFQSAMALARYRTKVPGAPIELLVQDFEQVTMAANEFDDYLYRTRGRYEPDRAKFNQLRAGERPQQPQQPQHQRSSSRGYNNSYYPTTPDYRPRASSGGDPYENPLMRPQSSSYLSPQIMPAQLGGGGVGGVGSVYAASSVDSSRQQGYQQQQQFAQQPPPPQATGYPGVPGSGQSQIYSPPPPPTAQFQQGQANDQSGITRQFNIMQPQQQQQYQ